MPAEKHEARPLDALIRQVVEEIESNASKAWRGRFQIEVIAKDGRVTGFKKIVTEECSPVTL